MYEHCTLIVDFDDTYTLDPVYWTMVLRTALYRGYRVVLCTQRPDTKEWATEVRDSVAHLVDIGMDLVFAGNDWKVDALRSRGYDRPWIFIDDSPHRIAPSDGYDPSKKRPMSYADWKDMKGKQMHKPKMLVMMGVAGSGKSTWAKNHIKYNHAVLLSSDDIREELTGDAGNQDCSKQAFEVLYTRLEQALTGNVDVIVDATSLTKSARKTLLDIAQRVGAHTQLVVIRCTEEQAQAQNKMRARYVPEDVITKHYVKYNQALTDIMNEPWDEIKNVWR